MFLILSKQSQITVNYLLSIVILKGVISKKAISIETTLAVLIGLYTGLRRMEILTLTSEVIDTPKSASGATTIFIGPSINCHTKGGESGEIKIPHWLMRVLLKYKRSSRYKKRLIHEFGRVVANFPQQGFCSLAP